MDYSLRIGRLSQIGQALHRLAREQAGESTEPMQRPDWATAEEGRTLRAFFDGDRLLSIPAQHAKRLIVLRQLAETVFERKRKYPEKEVNQLLAVRHPDAASLRRYLVDEGFMTRKNSVYRLKPRRTWPAATGQAVAVMAPISVSRANVKRGYRERSSFVKGSRTSAERRSGRRNVVDHHDPATAHLLAEYAVAHREGRSHVALARSTAQLMLRPRSRSPAEGRPERQS